MSLTKRIQVRPHPFPCRYLFSWILVTVAIVFTHQFTTSAAAQYATSSAVINVTASVPNSTPPTTPILIAPSNNSFVTTTQPNFVWQQSTSPIGISHYELYVDGNVWFGNIPTNSVDNALFTLTYNNSNSTFTLHPKNGLAQGVHTWKIRAIDNNNNGTDSATWTFTIDNQAPPFVVSNIGSVNTNISAQDPSTIPTSPLELNANSPLIIAHGEPGATVQVTVTIPGYPTQQYSILIDPGGNWQLQLGVLPRDVVITLDFIITDQAGNVSVLSGIQFIIPAEIIVFPPASPTPIPTPQPSISPPPGFSPPPTIPPDSIQPSPSASPLISISFVPPIETASLIVQRVVAAIPKPLLNFVTNLPAEIEEIAFVITQNAPIVATVAIPAVSLIAIATQLGEELSVKLIWRILQAIGLLPAAKPQGIVYNSHTGDPVAFALLTVTSTNANIEYRVQETVVTTVDGIYQGLKLPPGEYQISVSHQDYIFPTKRKRPPYFTIAEYYMGETFKVTRQQDEKLFIIPVDPIMKSAERRQFLTRMAVNIRRFIARIKINNLSSVMFVFSLIVALFFPTIINWIIVSLYALLFLRNIIVGWRVPALSGTILDQNGQPVEKAIVRISHTDSNQLAALVTSNYDGSFAAAIEPGSYQISVTKPNYAWLKPGSSNLAFEEIKIGKEGEILIVNLTTLSNMYDDMFN